MLDVNLSNKGSHWGVLRRESVTSKDLLCDQRVDFYRLQWQPGDVLG